MSTTCKELTARLDTVLQMSGADPANRCSQRPAIWIVDSDPARGAASLLQRSLAMLGMNGTRQVAVSTLSSAVREQGKAIAPLIISLSFTGENVDQNTLIEEWCRTHSMPWARVVVDLRAGYADAGPVFLEHFTPCYSCFCKLHLDGLLKPVVHPIHISAITFWCNVFAPLLLNLYRDYRQLAIPDGFRRYSLTSLQYRYLRRTFFPTCVCRVLSEVSHSMPESINPAPSTVATLVYEDFMCREKACELPASDRSNSMRHLMKKSLAHRSFPNSTIVTLASTPPLGDMGIADLLVGRTRARRNSLAVDVMAAILSYSVGSREIEDSRSSVRQWAASAGNLGSPEIFVCTRGVSGLEDGIYYYRSSSHDLITLQPREENSYRDISMRISEGEMLFYFTGSFHRLRQKYGNFGYRLVHIDGGVAFSQASLAARSLGISLRLTTEVDEASAMRSLNLSHLREYIVATALASIDKPGSQSLTDNSLHKRSAIAASMKSVAADSVGRMSSDELTRLVYLDSIRKGQSMTSIKSPAPGNDRSGPERYHSTNLSSVNRLTLREVLIKRSSIRKFTSAEVPRSALLTIIDLAYSADIADWPEENIESRTLSFFLIEQSRSQGGKTLYEYLACSRSFTELRTMLIRKTTVALYVDACFEQAPAAIWIVGDLAKATRAHGAYGHRQLLFRAGATANRLALAGLNFGIEGTICGGLLSRAARHVLGFDGWNRLALCAFVAGIPPNRHIGR